MTYLNLQSSNQGSAASGLPRWAVLFAVATVDGYDTLMLAFIAPVLAKQWHVQPAAIGFMFSATYLGAALGASVLGALADVHGRRRLLVWALVVAGGFGIACGFARTTLELTVLRAFSGVGLGAAIPIVSALAAELVPAERRCEAVTRVFIGYPIGAMLGGALTAALIGKLGWRGIFTGAGIVTLGIGCAALWILPRSAAAGLVARPPSQPFKTLIGAPHRLKTAIVCAVTFLLLLVSYFLVSWMPLVLSEWGIGIKLAALSSVLLNVGGVLGGYALALMSNRAPLRAMAVALAVGSLAVGLFGSLSASGALLTLGWTTLIGLCVIGAQINVPALTAQLYPMSMSATAVGAVMAAGRLGSIAGPASAGLLRGGAIGWGPLFAVAAVPTLMAAALLLCLRFVSRDHPVEAR